MIAIKCKSGKIFSAISSAKDIDAEWILQTAYYKSQGCTIEEDKINTFEKCDCLHCDGLEHEFEILIEEIRNK